jgi:hypothetical protein
LYELVCLLNSGGGGFTERQAGCNGRGKGTADPVWIVYRLSSGPKFNELLAIEEQVKNG